MPGLEVGLLTSIAFLPLGTGLLLLATSTAASLLGVRELPVTVWRAMGLLASLLSFALSAHLFAAFDATRTGFQFVEHVGWLPDQGIHYFVAVDGISLVLVLLTTFLVPVVFTASWRDVGHSARSFVFFLLALESGLLGAFVSLNLLQFYFFLELILVPTCFVIGTWGGPGRLEAAVKYLVVTTAGSLALLLAILVLASIHVEQFGRLQFDLVALSAEGRGLLDTVVPSTEGAGAPWWKTQAWLFAAFALAFAVKLPLVPFHTWLPAAEVEAPTAGAVVLAGALLSLGAYGFLRFALPLFPVAAGEATPVMLSLSLAGILYGALVAMAQTNLGKLAAYTSLAHMGLAALGVFAGNVHGLNGGVLQLLSHGVTVGALLLLIGMIRDRRGTAEIESFGGIAKPMPVLAACLAAAVLSSIGLPMLAGFVGAFLILMGTFLTAPGFAAAASFGWVLGAACALRAYGRVVFGPLVHDENRSLIDLGLREKAVVVAMLVPVFWIGVYPEPLLRRIEPSVIELLRTVARRAELTAPEPSPGEGEPAPELAALPWRHIQRNGDAP